VRESKTQNHYIVTTLALPCWWTWNIN